MPLSGVVNFESVTVGSTAVGLDDSTGGKSNACLITVEGAAIRYRIDGTDPTASVGHIAEAGDVLTLAGRDEVMKFSAIRKDGVDATLRVSHARQYVP